MSYSKFLVAAMVCAVPVWASVLPPLLLPCGEVRLDPAALPDFRARLKAASSLPAPTSAGESPAEKGGASRPGEPKGGNGPRTVDASRPVYVLQYDADETLSSAVRKAVAATGATLLSPVSGGAYLVRGTPAQTLEILDSGVAAAGRECLPADKIAAGLSEGRNAPGETSIVLVVSLFPDADPDAARSSVESVATCDIIGASPSSFRVRAEPSALHPLAALPSIQSVGPWLEPMTNPGQP